MAIAEYRDRKRWLQRRRQGLGTSDVAAIFGLSRFKTAHEVWLEKTGRAPLDEADPGPDARRGRRLESVAARFFAELTGLRVRRQPLRADPDHPWLLASIDRQILAGQDRGTGPLEIKVPRSTTFGRWRREGLPDDVILQGQCEAGIWRAEVSTFAIYNPDGDELLVPEVEFDEDVWREVIERTHDWWQRHVVADQEPDDLVLALEAELPAIEGDVPFHRLDTPEFARAARDFMEARELMGEAEAARDWARAKIIEVIGDSPCIVESSDGRYRFYYARRDGRKTFQLDTLRGMKPLDPQRVQEVVLQYAEADPSCGADLIRLLRDATLDLDADELYRQTRPYFELRGYRLTAGDE